MECPKCGYEIDALEEMKIKYKEADEYLINNILRFNDKQSAYYLESLEIIYNCIKRMESNKKN